MGNENNKPELVEEKMPQWAVELKEQNEELKKKVEVFEGLAGKNAIASWKEAQKDNTQKFSDFKLWNEKIIIGWGKLDYSKFVSTAKKARDENVMATVNYMDGTSEKINYIDFIHSKESVSAKILSMTPDYYEVEFNRVDLDKQKMSEEKLKGIQKKQKISINFLNS